MLKNLVETVRLQPERRVDLRGHRRETAEGKSSALVKKR